MSPERRRPALTRRWRVLAALVLLLAWNPVPAHDSIHSALAGVRLCVDDDSLDVRFERGGEVAAGLVRERLWRSLEQTFTGASLPWQRAPVCSGADGYLSVVLDVREAPWYGPRASAYELAVQVGQRQAMADGSVRASPAGAFDFRVVELFDERAVGIPAVVFLPRYVEAGLRDLSVRWWQDHLAREASAEAGRSRGLLGIAVAAGLAIGVGALLAAAITQVRRRSRRSSRRAATRPRPGPGQRTAPPR